MLIQTIAEEQAAEAKHRRLEPNFTGSDERNARLKLETAEELLVEARKLPKSKRAAAAIVALDSLVEHMHEQLERFAGCEERRVEAASAWNAADAKRTAAVAAHARGTLDADEALELERSVIVAEAALRVRNRELAQARSPARVPRFDLRKIDKAEDETNAFASSHAQWGLPEQDERGVHSNGVDMFKLASEVGTSADPAAAVFWPIFEQRALAAHEAKVKQRRRRRDQDEDDAKTERDELAQLFARRWEYFIAAHPEHAQ